MIVGFWSTDEYLFFYFERKSIFNILCYRQLQIQQIQQIMSQLQENEQFKALPLVQQQQLALQMMLKQQQASNVSTQQSSQKLSPPRYSDLVFTSTYILASR